MQQEIRPERGLFFCGDSVVFHLKGAPSSGGKAFLRTNLGGAAIRREEEIARVEQKLTPAGADWKDFPMVPLGGGEYRLTLPLVETGAFLAKCCFIPDDGSEIRWAEGDNFHIKVESAESAAANSIYCAFVRQFGPDCDAACARPLPQEAKALESKGYTVVSPSGTFRSLKSKLDHIFNDLGCRILQLLPIFPTPVEYGRMGRYGSPFAALDYFSVDPALAEFDPAATPLEQFGELVVAVHSRAGRIFLDLPVNHTGWASKLQLEHPDYFIRKEDGTFVSPGAWGVVWSDLCQLNYALPEVRQIIAKVFLFWCRRGVDGFRCDAGYMVPADAWDYIIAKVRREYPNTVFLLEGLGGPPEVQEDLLQNRGLDWGYSELFQNYDRNAITGYYAYQCDVGRRCGSLVNFAETHDNDRLAASGRTYADLRFCIAALMTDGGGFGFTNGAEFFAEEKIDVHGSAALNFGATPNLVERIRCLNWILAEHPAFIRGGRKALIQQGGGNVLALERFSPDGKVRVLVFFNLDCEHVSRVFWPVENRPEAGVDLLSGQTVRFQRENGLFSLGLRPGQSLCVDFSGFRLPAKEARPTAVYNQCADAMAKQVAVFFRGMSEEAAAVKGADLLRSPEEFVVKVSQCDPPPLTVWHAPNDCRREVMLPPGDVLLVVAEYPFFCRIFSGKRCVGENPCLQGDDGRWFALFTPDPNRTSRDRHVTLRLSGLVNKRVEHLKGSLCLLAPAKKREVFIPAHADFRKYYAFGSNRHGSYALFPAAWGELNSKYEALMAWNSSPDFPADRRTLFSRCRGWLVVNNFSQELNLRNTVSFGASPNNRASWEFHLPASGGKKVRLLVDFEFSQENDALRLIFTRPCSDGPLELEDASEVKLILRPDLECRVHHELTKAFAGAEQEFRHQTATRAEGFTFTPWGCRLDLQISRGYYHSEPRWEYMHLLPAETYYGLEDRTDLFSPGYFDVRLKGGETITLSAAAGKDKAAFPAEIPPVAASLAEPWVLEESLRRFVVKRDGLSTVIAGYPWFLDWGRDTLIVLRGLVQGHFRKEAGEIIREFASFEDRGTIPNMIRGNDQGNRDTSDAPLFLIVAARDYCRATGDGSLLDSDCRGRTLRQVLRSVAEHYQKGTPNGIRMDKASGLIFSPGHFTWMDTNFPAGTPREGYPIEIQALWYAALEFLGETELAQKVSQSIETLFFSRPDCCSDCLHCGAGTPAAAQADDHCRCNQLLALTLGAVKDPRKRRIILDNCGELLVPGGIRTLADRPVEYKLPVMLNGGLLNNPGTPYQGHYRGPENTCRKVAYHNGTVWAWPFPSYCEALYMLGGEKCRMRAMDLLCSTARYLEGGIPGEISEVADGDAPHAAGGCAAQAWSFSEFYRVWKLLHQD